MTPSAVPGVRVPIDLGARSYDIVIGAGLLDASSSWLGLPPAATVAIVTDSNVAALYAGRLQASLSRQYAKVLMIELPAGEAHKDWTTTNSIFDALLGAGCDRKTILFALGGGVVGDVAGFAAACYLRGIAY
ncbi:MAG: iron-containing alcohol dehydrogenase, partial [Burkholderiaceae bacterium]